MILFVVIALLCGWLFTRLPGSFLPEEDQGYALAIVQLPPGATFQRTAAVMDQVQSTLEKQDGFEGMMRIIGFSFVGQGENVGMAFVRLKPWDERKITAAEFIQKRERRAAARSATRRSSSSTCRPCAASASSAASTCTCRTAPARAAPRSPTRATRCSAAAGEGSDAARRAPEHARGCAAAAARRRSRAGAIDGAFGQRRVHRDPADVRAGLRQRFLLPGPHQARDDAGRRAVPHGSRRARPFLHADARSPGAAQDCDDSALERRQGELVHRLAVADALQRLFGGRDRRLAGAGQELRRGDGRDARTSSRRICRPDSASTGPASRIRKSSPATRRRCCSRCRSSSCSSASRRCTRAGRFRSRCCWSCRSACSARSLAASLRGLPNDIFFKIGLITIIGLAAKNAILIVEFAVAEQQAGTQAARRGRRRGAAAASADPDDVVRVHHGRDAARDLDAAPARTRATRSAPASSAACCSRRSSGCC